MYADRPADHWTRETMRKVLDPEMNLTPPQLFEETLRQILSIRSAALNLIIMQQRIPLLKNKIAEYNPIMVRFKFNFFYFIFKLTKKFSESIL